MIVSQYFEPETQRRKKIPGQKKNKNFFEFFFSFGGGGLKDPTEFYKGGDNPAAGPRLEVNGAQSGTGRKVPCRSQRGRQQRGVCRSIMLGRMSSVARRPLVVVLRPLAERSVCMHIPKMHGTLAVGNAVHLDRGARRLLQPFEWKSRSMSKSVENGEEGSLVSSVFGANKGKEVMALLKDGDAGSLVSSVFGADNASTPTSAEFDEDIGAERNTHRTEHFMEVLTENVKILIGRQGVKINSMMEESGAKIFISPQEEGQNSGKRKVVIRGTAEAVAKARALIDAQIETAATRKVDVVAETVQVPVKQTGAIIGKGGATIKSITAETGASITVDQRYATRIPVTLPLCSFLQAYPSSPAPVHHAPETSVSASCGTRTSMYARNLPLTRGT
jgi:hypothetical protein